jgi:hypothetical protein
MVEPLEETRSELIFATEPILSTLELSIPGYGRHASLVELDEVEVCTMSNTSRRHEVTLPASIADPKGYSTNLQGAFVPALFGAANPQ